MSLLSCFDPFVFPAEPSCLERWPVYSWSFHRVICFGKFVMVRLAFGTMFMDCSEHPPNPTKSRRQSAWRKLFTITHHPTQTTELQLVSNESVQCIASRSNAKHVYFRSRNYNIAAKLLCRPRVFCLLELSGDPTEDTVFPLLEKWNNLIQGVRLAGGAGDNYSSQ